MLPLAITPLLAGWVTIFNSKSKWFDMKPQEKRIFSRFISRFPTKFKDSAEDYGQEIFLRDVSPGGARVAARNRLAIDDVLSLEVQLPDGKDPVNLSGRVRWVHRPFSRVWEAGMEFHKTDLMRVQRIVKYSLDIPIHS